MRRLAYHRVRADYEYLTGIKEVDDCVEFIDAACITLMQNPTKTRAAQMYLSGVENWFLDRYIDGYDEPEILRHKPEIKEIADRYGFDASFPSSNVAGS